MQCVIPPYVWRDTKFNVFFFPSVCDGQGFLSRGFTDRREILRGSSAASQTDFLLFGGIAPGMTEFWLSTGAIWRDMLLAESFVYTVFHIC